jgi:GMP synthase (glutamine-hydrolysing)
MNVDARYLLLQIRSPDDPMRGHEVQAFCESLPRSPACITAVDLILEVPSPELLNRTDVVLIGGSGDYSVLDDDAWLDRAYELIRELRRRRLPTFGSCWGFQAIAKAFGGRVVRDPTLAELGTPEVMLTEAGRADPVFGPLGDRFLVPVGHEDTVVQLPEGCTLLAASSLAYHALRVDDAPMYATQFHPELTREGMLQRVRRYPRYVEQILGVTMDEFCRQCQETPQMQQILPGFLACFL